jgi:peroxiredoxin
MSIQKGDPIPKARIFELDAQGTAHAVSAAERFTGKRIVLFAVPGAFTRTCSQVHLPSFVQQADAIKAKGVDEIVCLAVNDVNVLAA